MNPDVEASDFCRDLEERLMALAASLPMPRLISGPEKEAATLIFEQLIPPSERDMLVEMAIRMRQQITFLVVALVDHLEEKKRIGRDELTNLISSRRTILRLVLE